MINSEENNQLIQVSELESKLSIEWSKFEGNALPKNPVDKNDIAKLKTSQKNKDIIIASHNFISVSQYPSLILKYKLLIAINKTILFVGHNVKDVDFLYKGVYEYVKKESKYLTIEEIEIAFKNGSMDEYGEWHGLSARTFCKWIKKYTFECRRKAMEEKLKIKNRERVQTPDEKYQSDVKWLNSIFDRYDDYVKSDNENFDFYDFGNHFYNLLTYLGAIDLTKEQNDSYINKATIDYKRKSNRQVDFAIIKIQSRHLIVKDWFKKAKEDNINLREMFEQKNGWDALKKLSNE